MRLRTLISVLATLFLGTGTARVTHAQTSSHHAAAEELVVVMKLGKVMQASTATMIDAQVRQNPLLAPYRAVMVEWARRYITDEAALPEFAKIYAAAFTEEELREIVKFYRTPIGQKLIARQVDLMRQGMTIGERLAKRHQPELVQMIEARAAELQQDGAESP